MGNTAQNNFAGGLVADLHPLTTPPTVLTKARNVEYITTEGNQVILQKRVGNDPELFEDEEVKLTDGFEPLAVSELNNIAYIISFNKDTGEGEIGTFPSPDYDGFAYVEGADYPTGDVTISSEFYDEEDMLANLELTPVLIEDLEVEVNTISPIVYNIANLSTVDDTAVLTHDLENELYFNPAIAGVDGLDSTDVDLYVIADHKGYYPEVTLTATSTNDISEKSDAMITEMLVYVPTAIVQWEVSSDASATGGNLPGTNIWKDLLTDPPVIYLTFAYAPNYAEKNVKVTLMKIGGPPELDTSHIVYTELESNRAITMANNEMQFNGPTRATVVLAGIETFLFSQNSNSTTTLELYFKTGSDEDAIWLGDISTGTDPVTSTPTIKVKKSATNEYTWQWGF